MLKSALKKGAYLILKEPLLPEDEDVPWLCPSGQWQHIRPRHIYQDLIDKMFEEVKTLQYKDPDVDCMQRMWLLKSRN